MKKLFKLLLRLIFINLKLLYISIAICIIYPLPMKYFIKYATTLRGIGERSMVELQNIEKAYNEYKKQKELV